MEAMYRRNPKVEEAPLQTDLMLFDPEKSQFFVLNPTMAYVWKNCDGTKTFDFIVESIREEFASADDVPVETDMRQALAQLVDLGLVTTA
jgi:coenzyme PQQ synthesis protein D (PqqD)